MAVDRMPRLSRHTVCRALQLYTTAISAYVITGDMPLDLVEEYTVHSGRMPVLPDWILTGALLESHVTKQKNAIREVNGKRMIAITIYCQRCALIPLKQHGLCKVGLT